MNIKNGNFICDICLEESSHYRENEYCYPCINNCKFCKNKNYCDQCDNLYYYINSLNECHLKKFILPNVFNSNNSSIIILKFNNTYEEYFEKLLFLNKRYFSLIIDGVENIYFDYKINIIDSLQFEIYIDNYVNIKQNTLATFNIILHELDFMNSEYFLITKTLYSNLNEIRKCPNNEYYNKSNYNKN